MNVRDINTMDKRNRFLYKREVDPSNPTYRLPSVDTKLGRMIGPIDGQ